VRNEIYKALGPKNSQGGVIFESGYPPLVNDEERVDDDYLKQYYGLVWNDNETNVEFGLKLSDKDVVHFPDTMKNLPVKRT